MTRLGQRFFHDLVTRDKRKHEARLSFSVRIIFNQDIQMILSHRQWRTLKLSFLTLADEDCHCHTVNDGPDDDDDDQEH